MVQNFGRPIPLPLCVAVIRPPLVFAPQLGQPTDQGLRPAFQARPCVLILSHRCPLFQGDDFQLHLRDQRFQLTALKDCVLTRGLLVLAKRLVDDAGIRQEGFRAFFPNLVSALIVFAADGKQGFGHVLAVQSFERPQVGHAGLNPHIQQSGHFPCQGALAAGDQRTAVARLHIRLESRPHGAFCLTNTRVTPDEEVAGCVLHGDAQRLPLVRRVFELFHHGQEARGPPQGDQWGLVQVGVQGLLTARCFVSVCQSSHAGLVV